MKFMKFFPVVEVVAAMSKDRSTKVGAIALDDNMNILATGYNGFPRGVDDDVESRHQRPEKYLWTAHAEENLIAQSAYSGRSLKDSTVLVSALFPCATCARLLVQAGVKKVVAPKPDNERWMEQNLIAQKIFEEANVEIFFVN